MKTRIYAAPAVKGLIRLFIIVLSDLYCDEPEHLEHGTFMCRPHSCNLFEIGTEVHFVCDAHYAPHPEDQLVQVCTLGGQWSGTPPRCLHGESHILLYFNL